MFQHFKALFCVLGSVYFQREFPKLVGDEDKEGSGQEEAQTGEKEQDLNRPGMGHPAMISKTLISLAVIELFC